MRFFYEKSAVDYFEVFLYVNSHFSHAYLQDFTDKSHLTFESADYYFFLPKSAVEPH